MFTFFNLEAKREKIKKIIIEKQPRVQGKEKKNDIKKRIFKTKNGERREVDKPES